MTNDQLGVGLWYLGKVLLLCLGLYTLARLLARAITRSIFEEQDRRNHNQQKESEDEDADA